MPTEIFLFYDKQLLYLLVWTSVLNCVYLKQSYIQCSKPLYFASSWIILPTKMLKLEIFGMRAKSSAYFRIFQNDDTLLSFGWWDYRLIQLVWSPHTTTLAWLDKYIGFNFYWFLEFCNPYADKLCWQISSLLNSVVAKSVVAIGESSYLQA